jgi:hypothetical protein
MEDYSVDVQFKKGGTENEDCKLIFTINDIIFYEMQFHWMGIKEAVKDFNKLPELIRRMNLVILTGYSNYSIYIDKMEMNIIGDIIKIWTVNTHYSILQFKINVSLMNAFKKLYNWYYKYIKIAEEAPPPKALIETKGPFSGYEVVTYAKDKIPDKLHLPYEV